MRGSGERARSGRGCQPEWSPRVRTLLPQRQQGEFAELQAERVIGEGVR